MNNHRNVSLPSSNTSRYSIKTILSTNLKTKTLSICDGRKSFWCLTTMSTISKALVLQDSTMSVSSDPQIPSLGCTFIDTLLNGIRNWLYDMILNVLLVVMSSADGDGRAILDGLLYILLFSVWCHDRVGVAFVQSFSLFFTYTTSLSVSVLLYSLSLYPSMSFYLFSQ